MANATWRRAVMAQSGDIATVDGIGISDAAWYNPDTKPAAVTFRDDVAFWRGVEFEP